MSGLIFVLLPYAVGALMAPFVIRADRRRRQQRQEAMQWVVDRLGLSEVSVGPWQLVARHGRRRVRIEQDRNERKLPITVVTVEG
ncbi:MAG TPA: hypothetical protein VN923_18135, partial [Thermoanaerobaculia bacterium]|nr:hypothetical protein [Thermoanaerobaculia bacterium]